ncbi:MAG TPA: HlyD family secretion protein [Alphaproteobacteria bacterium]|nr:HlyD family secretion protein [Alphaproteobacteria bacterium]
MANPASSQPTTSNPVANKPVTKLERPDGRAADLRDKQAGATEAPMRHGMSPARKRRLVRWSLMAVAPLAILAIALYFFLTGGRYVETDDAYVQAAQTSISTDVSGRVVELDVKDNQRVAKGQVLFKLDDRPFRIAVEAAEARLAGARLQVEAMKATYRQRRADLQSAEDTLAYRQREFDRQKRLIGSGVASQAQYDQASNALVVARQQVEAAQQQIANVLASLGGNPDIPIDQHPSVEEAQARLDRAKLDLSYTVIAAPDDGIVTRVEKLQVGDYVNASTPVFALLSTHRIWVEANFKEVELTHMRAGQPATIEVDTYPDHDFTGKVESLSPGTGAVFSLLPPQNASGNWVKVVQRLPVRISIDDPSASAPLHAGLSASVEVDTGYRRSLGALFDWLFGSSSSSKP